MAVCLTRAARTLRHRPPAYATNSFQHNITHIKRTRRAPCPSRFDSIFHDTIVTLMSLKHTVQNARFKGVRVIHRLQTVAIGKRPACLQGVIPFLFRFHHPCGAGRVIFDDFCKRLDGVPFFIRCPQRAHLSLCPILRGGTASRTCALAAPAVFVAHIPTTFHNT